MATITTACPRCGSDAAQEILPDRPDDEYAHLVPLLCSNTADCGIEFTYNTVTDQPGGDPPADVETTA